MLTVKNKVVSYVLIVLLFTNSCSYYKIKHHTSLSDKITSLNESISDERYFFIEQGSELYQGTNLEIRDQYLNLSLTRLDLVIRSQLETIYHRRSRNIKKDERHVFHEAFIKVGQDILIDTGEVEIPMASIESVDVVGFDTGKSIGNFMIGTLGVVAVLAIVVAATKSSCPFIYFDDGQSSSFVGEAFSSAMYPPMERHDYIPLPNPREGSDHFKIVIRNELQETEHINLAKLMVIEHPKNLEVMIDGEGKIHTIGKPIPPIYSNSNTGENVLEEIVEAGDKALYRFDHGQEAVSTGNVTMKFLRPANKDMAKLVVNAKISFWLDFAYSEFTSLLGDSYQSWVKMQNSRTGEELRKWQFEQEVPLKVFVKKANEWKYVGSFEPVGPFGEPRPMIMPLDISDIPNDEIEIRLQTGFNFWEVDYAVLDYSPDIALGEEIKVPTSAIDESDTDVLELITLDDNLYVEQSNLGDHVTLSYELNHFTGSQTSLFLDLKGYYEPIKNYSGNPDWPYLMEFNKPGRFTEFTKELLLEYTTVPFTKNQVDDDRFKASSHVSDY